MRKLLVLLFALGFVACESTTETSDPPASTATTKLPGIGSTFQMNRHRGTDSLMDFTVDAVLLQFMGRDSVVQLQIDDQSSKQFIDLQSNGDVALGGGALDGWIVLPIKTQQIATSMDNLTDNGDGHQLTDYTSTPKGTQVLTIKGKQYNTIVTEVKTVREYFDNSNALTHTHSWTEMIYWVPEIGYIGKIVQEENSDIDVWDLYDFMLK
jgi:hypothetical protein